MNMNVYCWKSASKCTDSLDSLFVTPVQTQCIWHADMAKKIYSAKELKDQSRDFMNIPLLLVPNRLLSPKIRKIEVTVGTGSQNWQGSTTG